MPIAKYLQSAIHGAKGFSTTLMFFTIIAMFSLDSLQSWLMFALSF